jgi:hypothetical protein
MRRLIPLLLIPALLASLFAEPTPAAKEPGMSPREIALDGLLSERESEAALEKVISHARENGISEQAILEARFLFHVDRNEDAAIASMLPEFIKQGDKFKIEDSAIFTVKEDWLAVVEYVQAIGSLHKGDKAAFKSHITEAFWLSPRQASAFAPHIERMRLEESMKSVKIDFETRLRSLGNGDAVTLKSLIESKKALLFHFWSPANGESQTSMPDYAITAKALGAAGIAMTSILPDDSPKFLTDARTVIQPLGANPPGAWLIDRKENPLALMLRIQTFPTFVLVSNEGKILFNGSPDDDAFWESLRKLDPTMIRPEMTEGEDR